jgi:pyoverdine/dityrosine biosynthesis protein Dit1
MTEEQLQTIWETMRKIILEDLAKRKMYNGFVRYILSDEQTALRLQVYQEFIQSIEHDLSLLGSTATRHETWRLQYDPK